MLALLAASAVASVRAEPLPVEAFAQMPLAAGADLSPGGRRVLTTSNIDGAVVVTILDLQTRQCCPFLRGESDVFRVRWCRWKTDERLLCGLLGVTTDFGPLAGATRLIAVDADVGRQRVLIFPRDNNDQATLRDRVVSWLPDAVRDPQLFRYAVSIAAQSDLKSLQRWFKRFTNAAVVREQIGMDDEKPVASSPRMLDADAGVPILMFHGTDDIQAPVIQSRSMSAALRKAGKPNEYVEFQDEWHQIDHEKSRVSMLGRIEQFLRDNLAGAGAGGLR